MEFSASDLGEDDVGVDAAEATITNEKLIVSIGNLCLRAKF